MENETNEARIVKIARERRKEGKKQKEKRGEFRKLIVEEEMEITRMIEEKEEKEEDLIEIRIVEKMVLRRFHKYLKIFKKKKSEKILTRKT